MPRRKPKIDEEFIRGTVTESLRQIMKETADIEVRPGEPRKTKVSGFSREITVLVGIVGVLEGHVGLNISREFALRFAERMLGFRPEDEMEMLESAVGELGNMICGRATMRFQEKGLHCDLCPPSIIFSEHIELVSHHINAEAIPVRCDPWEDLELIIALTHFPGRDRLEGTTTPTITGIITAEAFLKEIEKLFEAGEYAKALEQAAEIMKLNFACAARIAPMCVREAERLLKQGEHNRHLALQLAKAALEYDEFLFDAHILAADCHYAEEQYELALHHYQQSASIKPECAECYYRMGLCYERTGRPDRARKAYQVALKMKGYHDEARKRLDMLSD